MVSVPAPGSVSFRLVRFFFWFLFFVPSQASESGSTDDHQSQVLEWQEMVSEAVSSRDRAREEKAAMALRISHMEEEREGKGTARG